MFGISRSGPAPAVPCPTFHVELKKNIFCTTTFRSDFLTFTSPLLPAILPLLCFAERQKNNLNNGIKVGICVFEQGLFPKPHFIISVAFLRVF